jgi:enamine deaminase RidA (YjgF/YER057c/UK114 family)
MSTEPLRIERVYSGTPWEPQVAYCRAKRMGNFIAVAGTTAVDAEGRIVSPGDAAAQATFIFEKIRRALAELGASMDSVIRTRMFVTDLGAFDGIARAHKAAFEGIDPVASCVEVSALVDPALVIEIEVDAVVG